MFSRQELGAYIFVFFFSLAVHGAFAEAAIPVQDPPPCSQTSKSYPEVTCLNDLANLYQSQGQYAEAEVVLKRALAMREKALGAENLDVAWSSQRLGYLFISEAKYTDAEPFLKRALEIREKVLGRNHRDVSETLRLLAEAYVGEIRYPEAEPLYTRALAIREKASPPGTPSYPEVAESLDDLGSLYMRERKFVLAEPLFERALDIRQKTEPSNAPHSVLSLDHLAAVYTMQGKYAKAEPLFTQALIILGKYPGNPLVITILRDYAEFLRLTDRTAEADKMNARAQALRDKRPEQR
jgi:tetratricopeptide (TPR) repeat protein